MPRPSELVDVEADLIHETDRAYLIRNGLGNATWVPKSAVEYDANDGTFTMPRRIAEEKGLV